MTLPRSMFMPRSGTTTGARRGRLLSELATESRRCMALYALFNQAVADQLNLHPTDLQCLNLLSLERGPVTTGRVAELTGLTTGSATRLVDRLERAGYVVRQRDTGDRRRVLVATVPEKAEEFGRTWRRLSGDWYALFEELGDDQLALLIGHMRRTAEFTATQTARLRGGAPDSPETWSPRRTRTSPRPPTTSPRIPPGGTASQPRRTALRQPGPHRVPRRARPAP